MKKDDLARKRLDAAIQRHLRYCKARALAHVIITGACMHPHMEILSDYISQCYGCKMIYVDGEPAV